MHLFGVSCCFILKCDCGGEWMCLEGGWGCDAFISAISLLWRWRLCNTDISVNWISFCKTWDTSASSFMCCRRKGGRGKNPGRRSFSRCRISECGSVTPIFLLRNTHHNSDPTHHIIGKLSRHIIRMVYTPLGDYFLARNSDFLESLLFGLGTTARQLGSYCSWPRKSQVPDKLAFFQLAVSPVL